MTITSSNLEAHELIGLKVTVSNSLDPSTIGRIGMIRDETRNTIVIQVNNRLLRIPKKGSSLTVELPSGKQATLDSSTIQFRPEDRIKRRLAHW